MRDLSVDDARLDDGQTVLNVNLKHTPHAREFNADAAAHCERAARQTSPRAARHNRNALAREQSHHLRDLFS